MRSRDPSERIDRGRGIARRTFLRAGAGLFGLSLTDLLGLRDYGTAQALAKEGAAGFGAAKSCIVFFCWGGVSQIETWDPKPHAPAEVRGEFKPIRTNIPGIVFGEHMDEFAKRADKLAVVRSVTHPEAGHRNAAYWNLTGHQPQRPGNDEPIAPTRSDWPSLGSMVSVAKKARPGFPGAVSLPYPIADRGLLNGQFGGFLGLNYDPLIILPPNARLYDGVSPLGNAADLHPPAGIDPSRMKSRLGLLGELAASRTDREANIGRDYDYYHRMASDLLLNPEVTAAFDLEREDPRLLDRYGDHVCGRSAILARRLTGAGIPIVTVYAAAGDLNGSVGDNWDTHGDNFRRLRDRLLPPVSQASAALLDDLSASGRLKDTLVVWLTEFGRTPKLNGAAGRDHFPGCYSVVFAGGGIQGGQVLGRSDRIASAPVEAACGPPDLHATIFHALGIPLDFPLKDALGRPLRLCDGVPLPIFQT